MKSKLFYSILGLLGLAAAGYFVLIYLSPPEGFGPPPISVRAANTTFIKSEDFMGLESLVNLPVKADKIGWPRPFQSIRHRSNVPGIYVEETNENGNANSNANSNAPSGSGGGGGTNYNLNLNVPSRP